MNNIDSKMETKDTKTIIVTTDFTDSAANALNYACGLAKDAHLKIMLLHVATIPSSYAGEGVSLAAVNDLLERDSERLKEEMVRVKDDFRELDIEAKMVVGDFLQSLGENIKETAPSMILMGASGDYAELWQWGEGWLHALVSLSCPVLVVPTHIVYHHIRNIAFACDYKKVCLPEQIGTIKNLVGLSGAGLHIVHVTADAGQTQETKIAAAFKEGFKDLKPQYYTIENKHVIIGMAEFVRQRNIDLLVVIPRKHGLWYNLFNKSYTRQLARLNNIPVLALHDNG